MNRRNVFLLSSVVALLSAGQVFGQVSHDQLFRVKVNSKLSIDANTEAEIELTDSYTDETFASQRWTVHSNNHLGATLTMTCDGPFTHTVDGSYTIDANLTLTKVTGGNWANPVPATTSTQVPVPIVAVSTRAGTGQYDLDVALIPDTFTDLASGDYEMTVTGTLSANP